MLLRALALLLLFWGHAAFAQAPAWRVTETAGAVQVQHGGRSAAAVRGAGLQPGDIVTTGANGRAVLVRGQEYVIVAARSRLRLPAAAESGGIVQMLQDWGRATFRIEKKSTPHFGVRTPYLVALVKGTVFTVSADDKGARVSVTEGRVEVGTPDGGARQMVDAGMAASIASAQPGRIEMQPAAAFAGETAEAARACAEDGARSCGPKLDYEPVEVSETLSGPAGNSAPAAVADPALATPLTTALLALDPPAPAPAPAPDPAPAPSADPVPVPAPAPAPAPGTSPESTPAPANPAADPVPAAPATPAAPPPPPADPGSNSGPGSQPDPNSGSNSGPGPNSGPGGGTPLPPAPAPAPAPEPAPTAPGPAPAPETLPPPAPAPAPEPAPAPAPETLPPPTPSPEPAPPAPAPVPGPGPTPETLPPPIPGPVPLPPAPDPVAPSPVPPPPPAEPSCRLINLLIVCI